MLIFKTMYLNFFFYYYCFFDLIFCQGGNTPLHYAADEGFEEIMKILVEHGANIDLQNEVLIFFSYFLICF